MSLRNKAAALVLAAIAGSAIAVGFLGNAPKKSERHTSTNNTAAAPEPRAAARNAAHATLPSLVDDDDKEVETPPATETRFVGPERQEMSGEGVVIHTRALAPGYAHHAVDTVDLDEVEPEPEPAPARPSLPPGRTPVDPREFGAASLAELEAQVRTRLRIPSEIKVELWTEVRNGKRGLAIDTFPPGPRGTEQLVRELSSEPQRGG
jgi:hypothetical protein